jgi:hypothetical protein
MKLSLSFLLFSTFCFSQNNTVFVDSKDRSAIPNLAVRLAGGSVRFTNEDGVLLTSVSDYPIYVRNNLYEERSIDKYSDTVFLRSRYQELGEINVKPVDLYERYKKIRLDNKNILENQSRDTILGELYRYSMALEQDDRNSFALIKQRYSILGIMKNNGKYDWFGVLEESIIQRADNLQDYDTARLMGLLKLLPSLNKSYLDGVFQTKASKPSKASVSKRSFEKLETIEFSETTGDLENPFIESLSTQILDSHISEWSYSAGYKTRKPGFRWNSNEKSERHSYNNTDDILNLFQSTIHEKWYIFSAENGGYGAYDFELDFQQFILWDVEMSTDKKWLPWNKIEYSLDGLEKGFVDFFFKSMGF